MSEKEESLSLAALIAKGTKKLDKSSIKQRLKSAPYSQPLNRLAEQKKVKNSLALMKYAWLRDSVSKEEKDVVTIGQVSLKKKSSSSTTKAPKPSKVILSINNPKSTSPIINTPKNDSNYPISDFTRWINASTVSLTADNTSTDLNSEGMAKAKKENKKAKKTPKSKDKSKKEKGIEAEKKSKKSKKKKSKKLAKGSKKDKKKKAKAKSDLKQKIATSIKKKEEIATITLAKLYEEQGYIKKAIETYKQLSLINPEKSSFFAPLIEDLKNKLK